MKRALIAIVAMALLSSAACASKSRRSSFRCSPGFVSPVRITKPVDQQSAVIGLTMKSPAWVPNTEDRLYLVKIEKDRDLFDGTKLIPRASWFHRPAAVAAGRYTYKMSRPVATRRWHSARRRRGSARCEVTLFLLPKSVVAQSDTTVAPGPLRSWRV